MRMVWVCVLFFVLSAQGPADLIDRPPELDYEKIFKEGLKRRGTYLNLSGKKIGDAGLKLLLTKDWLKKVKKIDIRYNDLTEEGAKILAAAPELPKLQTLILRHNFFADNGSVVFSKTRSFPNLKELQLGWNEVRDAGALAIGRAQKESFPKLQKLDLRGNFLADETKSELKKTLPHLKSLKLY